MRIRGSCEHFGNLDHLLLGQRQVPRARRDVDPRLSQSLQHRPCPIDNGALVDDKPIASLTPEEDVVRHGEIRQQAQLLVDGTDAEPQRIARVPDHHQLAVDQDLPVSAG